MFEYDEEILSTHGTKTNNLNPVLAKSINKIIKNEGYITHSVYVRDLCPDGGNYFSMLKEVDIKGKTDKNYKETNLFIKMCLPDNEKNLMSSRQILANEVFTYTELAKLFDELQNKFNVPDKEKFRFVKYYNDDNSNSLILENMIKQGFKICNRFEIPPFKIFESAIKQLAKFHGFSIFLAQYRPDFFKNKIQTLKHTYHFDENGINSITTMWNITLSYLENDRRFKMEKILPEAHEKIYNYVNKNKSKFKCLCHGDYRMNNILVTENNGGAATVIPVDYQMIYYCSPVLDLLFSIFVSTDQQFRKNHLENLKNTYFQSLAKYLRYFNIDVESVYPQKEFEMDFKNQLEYGLLMAPVLLPILLVSEETVPDLNGEIKPMKLHDSFKSRIEGVVDDFIEWGLL